MRIRRENWPATNAPDEVVLRHLNVDDQRIMAPILDTQGANISDIQDSLGATHEEMVRAMNNFHDARRKLATPTPGHEAIQITHSPTLEEIPDGILTAGQGSDIINAMDDAEKAAYVRRQQRDWQTAESFGPVSVWLGTPCSEPLTRLNASPISIISTGIGLLALASWSG